MKRTLSAVPLLAVAALSVGVLAPTASASELPLPLPTTLPTSPTTLLQQGAALLPVPLPTASPAPSLLPAPVSPTAPSLGSTPTTTTSRASSVSLLPPLRSQARTRPVAAPAAVPDAAAPLTGATSPLGFSSANAPAWASYLTRTAAPTIAAAPAPAAMTATRAAAEPASSSSGPGAAAAFALVLLVMTGAGHVLVRRGVLPLR